MPPQPQPHLQTAPGSTSASASASTLTALISTLKSRHLPPTQSWLQSFISSQSTTSLAALASTATFRLLASDITQTLATGTSNTLPQDLSSAHTPTSTLDRDVTLQILDIHDVGRSVAAQLDDDDEGTQHGSGNGAGADSRATNANANSNARRVIIPVAPAEGDDDDDDGGYVHAQGQQSRGSGLRPGPRTRVNSNIKFLLQDAAGGLIWGFDGGGVLVVATGLLGSGGCSSSANANGNGTVTIGSKVLLKKGSRVARGVVMLERETVIVLGGKIEVAEKAWRDGRVARLKEMLRGG